ncbi:Tripeptidyl-peptidase sed2 [Cyphellophora attinorum]|uniref:tripeptidyl-peptidase II n=1 Tax=Cyphellophora attinorum TaxID=1664694 RepID=A0A0N1HYS5_9EURO|nr:Tripeptidyl-peptidase sed2 [Phialophora attinorum]KPI46085.1 Tripeptidyl-peptidase sed2 [Phialophora attinorum]
MKGVIAASTLPLLAAALTRRAGYSIKSEHPVPAQWQKLDRAPADHRLDMRIGLKQANFDELERQLYDVSSPSSSNYGQHLSTDGIHSLVAPAEDTLKDVLAWLGDHGVEELDFTPARDWIKVSLPVSKVEDLLNTEYHHYVHEDGMSTVRTAEWSLPHHLHKSISTIQPTNSFFGLGLKKHAPIEKRESHVVGGDVVLDASSISLATGDTIEAVCNVSLVTPTCVRTLYNTINYTVQSADKNIMAFTNYLGEVDDRKDAELMLARFRPDAVSEAYSFKKISIDGGTVNDRLNSTNLAAPVGLEGNLDTQAMISIGYPTPMISYSTGGSPPFKPDLFTTEDTNEPYLVWLDYILSQPDPLPSVISTSYGDDEQTVPEDYAKAVCAGFAQLGARGVTLFFSSGDNGIGANGYCYSNDGSNSSTFLPAFPAGCPYVTTVGGTYQFEPEVAVFRNRSGAIYTAGGGFSNYFPAPKYQGSVVSDYIDSVVKPLDYEGLYNPAGRGYPDIAGQSLYYSVYWNETLRPISGTSMSSPLVAAIFALVNDALIAAGKPVLGFLNPWIYEKGYTALNDILSGAALGCDTEKGLPAAEGWDAVTGYGTPDFLKILDVLGVGDGSGWKDAKA